jgi:hypothetical protein
MEKANATIAVLAILWVLTTMVALRFSSKNDYLKKINKLLKEQIKNGK